MVHSHSESIIFQGVCFGVKLPRNVEILPITEKDEELFASYNYSGELDGGNFS
jgi:hypothetical protein